MPERRELDYDDFAALRADVERLRRGHQRSGNWSLAQICWHLDHALIAAMKPTTYQPNTPEQDARREVLEEVLRTRRLPKGIVAPPDLVPPANVPDTAIDSFLETLARFERHQGPLAPHRIFGNMPMEDRRKQQLIHAAHHLSYLTPIDAS